MGWDYIQDFSSGRRTCPLKELKEVIIQGLFHASPRILRHGEKWKKYAQMMDDAYGYSLLAGKDLKSGLNREGCCEEKPTD